MDEVLIIDDDQKNIFALAATLRAKGWKVNFAGSAKEGMRMLSSNTAIGVVLLDMMMPGIDGYETISLIRNHEKLKNIPVISVTAQAMTGDKEKCLAAGADDYVSKPIDVDRLFDLLNKYIIK